MLTEKACAPVIAIVPTAEMNDRAHTSDYFSRGEAGHSEHDAWNFPLAEEPWFTGVRNHGSQVSLAVWDYQSLPFLEACMAPSGSMKASSQKRGVHGISSSGPLGPVSEVHVSSAIGTYLPHLGGKPKDNSSSL